MSTITGNAATTTATKDTSAATTTVASTKLSTDYQMFLKLLTTQMQNQDPLSPMDTAQYTQQLVQYSQVEQSIQQTGALKDILARMSTQDMAQASTLIGHDVKLPGADASVAAGDGASWAWSLPAKASSVVATVTDAAGNTVSTQALDADQTSGRFTWDGKRTDGSAAPAGTYTMSLAASAGGSDLTASVNALGTVKEVTAKDGAVSVSTSSGIVPLSSVVGVS